MEYASDVTFRFFLREGNQANIKLHIKQYEIQEETKFFIKYSSLIKKLNVYGRVSLVYVIKYEVRENYISVS